MALTPCNDCQRHVRDDEPSCPFCGGELSRAPQVPIPARRMSRAALVAFGATALASVAATGCSSSGTGRGTGGGGGSGNVAGFAPAYGVPGGFGGMGGSAGAAGSAGSAGNAGSAGSGGAGGNATDGGGGTAGAAPPYGIPPDDGGTEP